MSDAMQQGSTSPDAPSTTDDGLDSHGAHNSVNSRRPRAAAIGTRPDGASADGQIVKMLPDQIDRGGPIDEGNAGMWQPNAMGGGVDTTDWEDRHRLGGPKELKP